MAWASERVNRLKVPGGLRQAEKASRALSEWLLPELQADLDRVHARARECFGYKRRDMNAEMEPTGSAKLTTPDFEYSVTVELDPEDPGLVRWRRQAVCGFAHRPQDSRLADVFGDDLDSVEYRFEQPIPIADVIDRLEEQASAGIRLDYDSLCRWCEIGIEGFPASVRLENRLLIIRPRAGSGLSLREILDIL
jgi:hypothetical protein